MGKNSNRKMEVVPDLFFNDLQQVMASLNGPLAGDQNMHRNKLPLTGLPGHQRMKFDTGFTVVVKNKFYLPTLIRRNSCINKSPGRLVHQSPSGPYNIKRYQHGDDGIQYQPTGQFYQANRCQNTYRGP